MTKPSLFSVGFLLLLFATLDNSLAYGDGIERSAIFYLSPDGNDKNSGTLEQPWRSLRQALKRLQPGDNLVLRGGSYREGSINITLQGTAAKPITLSSYPGEKPIIDGRHAEFLETGRQNWELVDPSINLYRSMRTYEKNVPSANLELDGRFYKLNSYGSYEGLTAKIDHWSDQLPFYVGPGIYQAGDGRFYVRLDWPRPAAIGRLSNELSTRIQANPDPNKFKLHISTQSTGLRFSKGARHIIIDGIGFQLQRFCIRVDHSSFLSFRNLDIRCGKWGMVVESSNDISIDHVDFLLDIPQWIAWSDVKREPRPAESLKGTGISIEEDVCNIEVKNSKFENVFDGIVAVNQNLHNMRVHHNLFRVRDDALQLGTATSNIEFDHNWVLGPGPSHHGTGNAKKPGNKYMHHNIIDVSTPILWGRKDPDEILEPKLRGWHHHRPFGSHTGSIESGGDPWKIYNNTLIVGQEPWRGCAGTRKWGHGNTGFVNEVYNNVIVQIRDECVARELRVDTGEEIYDGNLYFRAVARPMEPFFKDFQNAEGSQSFASLSDFKRSTFFAETKTYYPPGWESSGIEADPKLQDYIDGDYRPAADGAAASGAIDLRGKSWPGVDTADRFRGAVDPMASTKTGDVGPQTSN